PWGQLQVELEDLVQFVWAEVEREVFGAVRPHLADGHALAVVLVEDLAPPPVHVVDLGAAVDGGVHHAAAPPAEVAERRVLEQTGRDVDAEAVHTAVEPEPQDVLELALHLRVAPVEVRLLARVEVQVPLAVVHPRPGGAAERGRPVVRRAFFTGTFPWPARAEDVAGPLRRARRRGERLPEPGVPV